MKERKSEHRPPIRLLPTHYDLSIVIPTFNERENIQAITQRIHKALRDVDKIYEIWFIDDSSDDTPQVLADLDRSDLRVNYVHREGERGLATAVVEGFRRSRGRYIVVMDADMQHPPELLPIILRHLDEGIDVVIPSRFIPGGSDGGLNWFRKWVSWTARTIGRFLIRRLRGITDCTGGYFGMRREVIDGVSFDPIGWKILMEVLVKGRYRTVQEIPYVFRPRGAGKSKMSLREQWNYLRHVWRLVWSSTEDRRFYVYCMVGALGIVVNTAVLVLLLYGLHLPATVDGVIASLVAMVHNYLLHQRLTWGDRGSIPR
ncbi:MAG: glycosyltransferase family 2 protein [Alicyclobacillus sp.]|nr:glycosyltransferase family 2 protein [Alicyclobacillus sp.]